MSDEAESILQEWRSEQSAEVGPSPASAQVLAEWREGTEDAAEFYMQANLDPGQYAPAALRWSLARGDNMREKRLRLAEKFPQGQLDVLPQSVALGFESDALLWRESPQAQWKFVEPQGFDRFDIAELVAPSAESIAGETLMAIGTSGGSVPATVFRQGLGALAGEAIEQAAQSVGGVQAQDAAGILGEVSAEGFFSVLGGFATSPFAALYNVARGAGALRVGDEGIETMRAAGELDAGIADRLTPGLVTDNPALQLSEKQSAVILPGLNRRYRDLISKVDTAVRTASPGNADEAMSEVVAGLRDFSDYFLRSLPNAGTKASKGGEAIQQGIQEYSEQSRVIVDQLYEKARSLEAPQFELQPVFDLAGDLRVGAKGQLDSAVEKQIRELETITGPIEKPSGGVISVTDQIRNVRTALWALKHVEPGKVANQANGQANDLYRALTDVLDNPITDDPLFKSAWLKANRAAKQRLTTLEKAPIVAAAKTAEPSGLVRTYLRPGNYENLLAIRDTVSAKRWNEFVDAGYSEILRNPENVSQVLRSFDQETLDVFMPKADQKMFRRIGRELDRIFAVGADEIAEQQIKNRNFVDKLIRSSSPRNTQTVIRAMNNTNNRAMRDSMRAAIVEWSWDGVVEATKDGLKINRLTLKKHVELLKDSGMWSVLSPQERRIIQNADVISRAFQKVQDAGTSLLGASAVAGVKRLEAAAFMTFIRSGMVAQFYMSPLGRQVLIGKGLPNSNAAMLRAFGGALAQVSVPEDLSGLEEEQ